MLRTLFFTLMTANGPLMSINAARFARWIPHGHSCCMLAHVVGMFVNGFALATGAVRCTKSRRA